MSAHLPYIKKYPRVRPKTGFLQTMITLGYALILMSMGLGLASYVIALIAAIIYSRV